MEVADFNFGETQSVDMEYKTFQQRLVESILEAMPSRPIFRRNHSNFSDDDNAEPESPGGGDVDSNIRYNAMS